MEYNTQHGRYSRVKTNAEKQSHVPYVKYAQQQQLCQTCSTIEIRPIISEAPHLRSYTPHPKPDFSQNEFASRSIIP